VFPATVECSDNVIYLTLVARKSRCMLGAVNVAWWSHYINKLAAEDITGDSLRPTYGCRF